MDSIAKKVEFSNSYRGEYFLKKKNSTQSGYGFGTCIVELRALLSTLLRLHEREKAKFLHSMFGAFLEKIRLHTDLLFAIETITLETPFRGR